MRQSRSLPGAIVLLTLALYPYVYLSTRALFLMQAIRLGIVGSLSRRFARPMCLWRSKQQAWYPICAMS